MRLSWILHIAKRYFLTKRKEKGHTASILSVSGIAVGVMTLMTVISVMNGLQQGKIANINEIRSFHIRVEAGEPLSDEVEKKLLSIKCVNAVNEFADIDTIIHGFFKEQKFAAVRAVNENILEKDSGFSEHITITKGEFNISDERSIVLGSLLARSLGVRPGDTVDLLSLAGKGYEKLSPVNIEFEVKGIFTCGYDEINYAMAFISMESASLFVPESDYVYGLKLDNHFRDREVIGKINNMGIFDGVFIESWRSYNRSLFSALKMEKVMMMLLVSLIFIVVAVNIFHSMRRSVIERLEEIALMKAVGAEPVSIQLIFILEGAVIGFLGSTIGAVLGYLVSTNVNPIFNGVGKVIGFVSSIINSLFNGGGFITDLPINSSSTSYLTEVSVVIMSSDVVYIIGIAFFSALAAAWIASKRISIVKPVRVLRYQ